MCLGYPRPCDSKTVFCLKFQQQKANIKEVTDINNNFIELVDSIQM